MTSSFVRRFPLFAIALLCAACASTQVVSKPSAITLEDAMASVGRGFVALKKAENGMQVGILPSEVTVTFNIAASGKDGAKLVLDLNPNPAIKAGGEAVSELTTSRGNQITIKYSNILFADEKTVVAKKDAAELKALIKVVRNNLDLSR